jgi:hypothetical protein
MALYDSIMSGTMGLAKGIFGGAASFARATPTGFMMAGGATVGAGLAVARGDNQNSTSLMRNIIGGATAGAITGLGARALFTRTAARGAGGFLGINQVRAASSGNRMAAWNSSPLGKIMGGTAGSARGVIGGAAGIGRALVKHPEIGFTGAIVAGGAIAMGGTSFTTESALSDRFSLDDKDIEQRDRRGFQNSAAGMSFGLHRRRHGG